MNNFLIQKNLMFELKENIICLSILCAIPILGAIKNLVKKKSFNPLIFARTFIVYGILYKLVYVYLGYSFKLIPSDSMILSLGERYGMFVYKIGYSIINKNYQKKKYKYYEKYNMDLSSNSLEKLNKFVSNESNSKENKKIV